MGSKTCPFQALVFGHRGNTELCTGKLLIRLRKIPTVVCRAESDDADEEEACEHGGFGRTRDDVENIDDRSTDDGGACVDVLYENVGHLK